MNSQNFPVVANEILEAVNHDYAELTAEYIANYAGMDYEADGDNIIITDGETTRAIGLEYNEEGQADGYTYTDYDGEIADNWGNAIGTHGGALTNAEELANFIEDLHI